MHWAKQNFKKYHYQFIKIFSDYQENLVRSYYLLIWYCRWRAFAHMLGTLKVYGFSLFLYFRVQPNLGVVCQMYLLATCSLIYILPV